ncbi:fimbrial protein [Proteus alimentorum]|uniref:Fimbrial protein n=1 Tax=Proteus alimentorum TaxID=1973495 RepID=A0ABS0IQF4_9GAMM|nr:fimbrial protein [Proteus alimentorum]MBG2876466.1 fimbrial protein [Proteus alimentorum]MBG2878079.1 fimbrial protein [Proteus alimentorum]
MKNKNLLKMLLISFSLLTSISTQAYSTVNDISGHVAPIWRGSKNIQATLATPSLGTVQFGDPILDTSGKTIEAEYIPHFHLSKSSPRLYCTRGDVYRGVVSPEGIGVVLGERDGYAVIQSTVPGIGYRLEVGAVISGSYVNPKVKTWSPIGMAGASNIEIPCVSGSEFGMSVKMTLVRTNEKFEDSMAQSFYPIHVSSPYPVNLQLFDKYNSLVLVGEFTRPLKTTTNIAVKYLKDSCKYRFTNKEHLLNLGKVGSGQFKGIGSTAYGDSGQQKVDVIIDCNNVLTVSNIRASIFEAEGITPASESLRRQGVLLNNLTGQNAAQGIGVQVLINNETKPLGSDNYAYVDNDTQWDVASDYSILRGIYMFSVSGRYYQTEEKIREGKVQTTMGFTIIYR